MSRKGAHTPADHACRRWKPDEATLGQIEHDWEEHDREAAWHKKRGLPVPRSDYRSLGKPV